MAVITRRIEVYVAEENKELATQYKKSIYDWRYWCRSLANIIATHMYAQENVRKFCVLKDDIQEKFHIKDILKEGKGMSEQNITYKICSEIVKGKMPSSIYTNLNQQVRGQVKADMVDISSGKKSLRSYKNNIGIPYDKKEINFRENEKRYYFSFYGIPMCCRLGADRSNNEAIIRRIMEGEYQACTSAIMIDDMNKDKKTKMFLLLAVDMPQKVNSLKEDKILFASLDIATPIVCTTDVNAKNGFDAGMKKFYIGDKEEFLHPRLAIQAGLRRSQIAAKYSKGGHGRKRKLQSLDRWHKKERNYIQTKTHVYSRELVRIALKNKCGTIILLNQKAKEEEAKKEEFLLRNWSYYGLKEKIAYKANMEGIKVVSQ